MKRISYKSRSKKLNKLNIVITALLYSSRKKAKLNRMNEKEEKILPEFLSVPVCGCLSSENSGIETILTDRFLILTVLTCFDIKTINLIFLMSKLIVKLIVRKNAIFSE